LGRASESDFDTKNAPLSAFLYKSLGPAKTKLCLDNAKNKLAGQLNAREFLQTIDSPIIAEIVRASASMVLTRREKLLQYNPTERS
jgi:hypothetical protein